MEPDRKHPLTTDHARMIDKSLTLAQEGLTLADRCEQCGLDVSARRGELEAVKEIATNLKRHFFPDRK